MTSAVAPRCPQCVAPIQDAEATSCSFCGTVLPREAPPVAPRSASVAELLASVERHSDYRAWCAEIPSSAAAVSRPTGRVVGGLLFAALAIVMLSFSRSTGAPGPFRIFLLLFVFLGAGMA